MIQIFYWQMVLAISLLWLLVRGICWLRDRRISLKRELADNNHRVAKANKEYYLLKQETDCPVVIAECGFLSNEREAALLCSEEYQEKIAFSLLLGIMEYINYEDKNYND